MQRAPVHSALGLERRASRVGTSGGAKKGCQNASTAKRARGATPLLATAMSSRRRRAGDNYTPGGLSAPPRRVRTGASAPESTSKRRPRGTKPLPRPAWDGASSDMGAMRLSADERRRHSVTRERANRAASSGRRSASAAALARTPTPGDFQAGACVRARPVAPRWRLSRRPWPIKALSEQLEQRSCRDSGRRWCAGRPKRCTPCKPNVSASCDTFEGTAPILGLRLRSLGSIRRLKRIERPTGAGTRTLRHAPGCPGVENRSPCFAGGGPLRGAVPPPPLRRR